MHLEIGRAGFAIFFVTECIPVNNKTNGWMFLFFVVVVFTVTFFYLFVPHEGHNTVYVILEILQRLVVSTQTA